MQAVCLSWGAWTGMCENGWALGRRGLGTASPKWLERVSGQMSGDTSLGQTGGHESPCVVILLVSQALPTLGTKSASRSF